MYKLLFLLFFSFTFANGSGDSGGCLDPEGRPCVRSLGDEGSGSDPHGGRVTGQGGGAMDPNGGE